MDFRQNKAALEEQERPVTADPSTGYVYFYLTDAPVAYTAEVADGITADYDEGGLVRGIEAESQQIMAKLGGFKRILELAQAQRDRTPSRSEMDGP